MSANSGYVHRDAPTLVGTLVESHDRTFSGGIDWNADIYRFFCNAIIDVVHLVDPSVDPDSIRAEIEMRRNAPPVAANGAVSFAPTGPSADDIAAALLRQMQAQGLVHNEAIATTKPSPLADDTVPEPGVILLGDGENKRDE